MNASAQAVRLLPINPLYLRGPSFNHAAMPKFGCALLLAGLMVCRPALAMLATAPSYIVDSAPPGLPQNSVIAMVQTRDGYLWLGTVRGLARFDGSRYELFNEWNTPGLSSSTIVHLFEDSHGGLWIGAGDTVALLKDGQIATLDIPGGNAALRSTCEDATGAVWLYLADSRLVRCRNGKVENVWPVGLELSFTRNLITAASGQIWIGTDTQLFRLASDVTQPNFELLLHSHFPPGKLDYLVARREGGFWMFAGGQIYQVPTNGLASAVVFADSYPWSKAPIKTAIEDHSGNLVVGTLDQRVFRFTSDGSVHRIEGLSQDTALSLCEDREGNMWVGTDGGGLNRVKLNPFAVAEPWFGYVVQSIAQDASGGLWFGFNGGGAVYWRGETRREFGPADGLGLITSPGVTNQPNFSAVLVDREQRVWVGDRQLGLFQFQNDRFVWVQEPRLEGRNVSALFEDRAGNLWVGTDLGLAKWNGAAWRWFDRRNGLTSDRITAIAEDHEGNLWVGTERNGLNRGRGEEFTAIREVDGLPCENVTALFVDRENVLWVGTGNGLGRYQAGEWSRFTTRDGLASDWINYLIEDDQDNLWIGSSLGLMRVAKKSLASQAAGRTSGIICRVYGVRDGLPTSECTQGSQPAACRTDDGRLWFPTIRGLVSVDPANLIPNTNAPLVDIQAIFLDDRLQNTNRLVTGFDEKLVIPAGVERLDILYTSLNLAAPEQARFRYWMEGLEEAGWSAPTDRRSVSYSKLPPGEYLFRVKASNEDGLWNPIGVSLAITVLPPFWRTWWFQTLVVIGALGTISGVVYLVFTQKLQRQLALLRQQEALERERARIARDLHDQLGANLTQVALLGEMVGEDKDLPLEVEAHAQQICQTARTTSDALDEIVWAANPSNDTLEGLVNYACKYAQDYLSLAGLRYRLEVPPSLPAASLPPDLRHNVFLAFKESVNNVVKHAKATEVKIRLRLEANQFKMEIADDGCGPAEAATKTGRNGLRNMRKRMEDVGGTFEMQPSAERGTVVRLTAPLTNS